MFTASADYDNYEVGDIIEHGLYPQSLVKDKALCAALMSEATAPGKEWLSYGYYYNPGDSAADCDVMVQGDFMKYMDITYSGEKYRCVLLTKLRPDSVAQPAVEEYSHVDDNGYEINTPYFFKYEPIKWRVLNASKGTVISDAVIDAQPFSNTVYLNTADNKYYSDSAYTMNANLYATSSLKAWNDSFCNSVFSFDERTYITIHVGAWDEDVNRRYSDSRSNFDIAPLLYSELIDRKNEFNLLDESKRVASSITDYAMIQNAPDKGWLTRSGGTETNKACSVSNTGEINKEYDIGTVCGIRPYMEVNFYTVFPKGKSPAPTVAKSTMSSLTLSWNRVPGALKYDIYRYNETTGVDERIAYVTAPTNSFIDSNLKLDTEYKYRIQALSEYRGEETKNNISDYLVAYTTPDSVSVLKAVSVTASSVSLSWNDAAGASGL